MSREFLTSIQAYNKIEESTPPSPYNDFITKSRLVQVWGSNIDTSVLSGLANDAFVTDDHVVVKTEAIQIVNISYEKSGEKYGYYTRSYGNLSLISNSSRADTLQANVVDSEQQVTINCHLRSLVPGTYNRINITYSTLDLSPLHSAIDLELFYASTDWTFFSSNNNDPALVKGWGDFIKSHLNTQMRMVMKFYHD